MSCGNEFQFPMCCLKWFFLLFIFRMLPGNFTWCSIITLCASLLCYSWLYRALLYLPSHPLLRLWVPRNSSDGSSFTTSTIPDILLYPFWAGWSGRTAHNIQWCNDVFCLFSLLCRYTQENGSFSHANTTGHHCCLLLEETVPAGRSCLVGGLGFLLPDLVWDFFQESSSALQNKMNSHFIHEGMGLLVH